MRTLRCINTASTDSTLSAVYSGMANRAASPAVPGAALARGASHRPIPIFNCHCSHLHNLHVQGRRVFLGLRHAAKLTMLFNAC